MTAQELCKRIKRKMTGLLKWSEGLILLTLILAGTKASYAQGAAVSEAADVLQADAGSLPNAPVPSILASSSKAWTAAVGQVRAPLGSKTARTAEAGEFDKFIEAGETAPRSTVGDKVLIGLRGSVSPYAVIGWVTSATYSEAINGAPNYGQNGKDYLQRLGAAAARATSEDVFTHSVMAPVLHEDVRYYQMGPAHGFFARATYSISRVLVAKTDAGADTPNVALLTGNLEGAALTQLYYPPFNRSVGQVAKTFGTSLVGQAVGNLFDEFILSSAEFLQLKRKF